MKTFRMVETTELERAKKYIADRVEIDEITGCHLWKLAKSKDGYGKGAWNKKTQRTHRLSYAVWNGGVIDLMNENGIKLHIRHGEQCQVHCCNAAHLTIGTAKDNAADRVVKGTDCRGEKSKSALITEEIAKAIIESKYPKEHKLYITQKERAEHFGVSVSTIQHIDCGEAWNHLPRKQVETSKKEVVIKKRGNYVCLESEKRAKLILLTKRHKSDPEYKTATQRALEFGVRPQTISKIDIGRIFSYLPRPNITEFSKPLKSRPTWTLEESEKNFKKIKTKCKYSEVANEHTDTLCLEWTGKLRLGRPKISLYGSPFFAYIISCEYGNGRQKLEDEQVLHKCNNEICCEPTHLEFGSNEDNAMDALSFGVSKRFKLNYEKAETIRQTFKNGNTTIKEIAYDFNVDINTIKNVISNKSWIN